MDIHLVAVVVASIAQFIIGAIWYMPLFGRAWGKIHGMENVPPGELKVMQKKMMPLLSVQFVVTIMTTFVLAMVLGAVPPSWNSYGMAGFLWVGFIVPTQVSAVLFGGTDPRYMVQKIFIMAGGSLVCLLAGTYILTTLF